MKITRRMESFVRYGIIALGLYLLAASAAIYTQLDRLRDAQEFVEHTQDVQYALQDTLSLVLDAESSQRGFMLNKNEQFLMDHFSAVTRLRSAVAEVKRLTKDNSMQSVRAEALGVLIETKIEQFRASINFAQGTDLTTAPENARTGASRSVAVEIRADIDQMLNEEDRLFAERKAEVASAERVTVGTFLALLLLFAGVSTTYFIVTGRNLAHRTAMLAELREAKEKSDRADKFKGDLLNYLGRALRNPLTDVTQGTDLLLYRAENALSPKDQAIVGEIRASARFLLSLAHNFLHIGRLQAGKTLHLEEDDCDLMEIVHDAVANVSGAAAKRGVAIHTNSAFARALIRCDKHKVKQIFLSLLDNAIKNSPHGGRIDVAASKGSGGDVVVTLRDTGKGIAPERLAQVMTPFALIDNIFAREEQGIGLGLPLAMGFAQAHGGDLQLESSDHGTTAILTLPGDRVIKVFQPVEAA